ncbi:MAG: hypothetical protein GY913_15880 [Proteobacteria bacterium]|nr:hypothetical protein [Pseudomonadota bacterium]MCP4918385.1 hypothetical protein [Pseudomonadota bacterium]
MTCVLEWPTTGSKALTSCDDCLFAWATDFDPAVTTTGDCASWIGLTDGATIEDLGLEQGFGMGFAYEGTSPYSGSTYPDVWMMFFEDSGGTNQWYPWAYGTWDGSEAVFQRGTGNYYYY